MSTEELKDTADSNTQEMSGSSEGDTAPTAPPLPPAALVAAMRKRWAGPQPQPVVKWESIDTWPVYAEKNSCPTSSKSKRVEPTLNGKISLWRGDITRINIDAIVNAANTSLMGGGGVDGAIHSAAGPRLRAECRSLNGAETGETKMTDAYDLPCKKILHTVGPIAYRPPLPEPELISCYRTSMDLALRHNLRSLCFCCVSTGVFGYPNDLACRTALSTVRQWLEESEEHAAAIDRVVFCVFLGKDLELYEQNLGEFFPLEEIGGPAENNGPPAENNGAQNNGAPAENNGAPAENNGAPAENNGAPAESNGAPAENNGAPAENNGGPS